MVKIYWVVLLVGTFLCARENPFVPVEPLDNLAGVEIPAQKKPWFKSQEFKLPSSARVLKSVEIRYQNLDGSIESKILEIDKKIDWHDTFIVTKKDKNTLVKSTTTKKRVQKKSQNKQNKLINFKNILLLEIDKNRIKLKTKDKKIRDFMVAKPYKVVIDFKREISFYTKVYKLNIKGFKSITIGKHSGYYRVAIELDGQYLYELKETEGGFLLSLR